MKDDLKIMVIDTSERLHSTCRIIQQLGYKILQANSGKESLSKTSSESPDIIILNVDLPDLDSSELIKKLKNNIPTADPLIVLLSEDEITIEETEADAYIIHPIGKDQLKARIKTLIRLKKLEKSLNKINKQYRLLFEQAGDGLIIHDLTGNILDVNSGLCDLFGYSKSEFLKLNIADILPPSSDYHQWQNEFAQNSPNQNVQFEQRFTTGDGETLYTEVTSGLINVDNQSLIYTIIRDITEHIEAAKVLKERSHDLGERVKELHGLYKFSKLVEVKDITLDEIYQGLVELIPDAWQYPEITCAKLKIYDREFQTMNYKKTPWQQKCDVFVNGEKAGNLIVGYLEERPDLDEGPFIKEERLLINALCERLGHVIERKQGEDTLRFQAKLLDSVQESIVATDLEGNVIYWGKGAKKLYGYDSEEIMGKSVTILVDSDHIKEEHERMEQVRQTGSWQGQYQQRRKDGTIFWADTFISIIKDENGKPQGMIGIDHDITDQKEMEKELKEKMKDLKKFNKVMVGRENRMIELKKEVNQLSQQLGKKPPYNLDFLKNPGNEEDNAVN
jgi:PAS domain S-box-containing protein